MAKILGIPAAVFVIGVLVVGSGAALLVNYLSNSFTHTVNISSPLVVTGSTPDTIHVFGGENISYTVTTTNQANVSINSYRITEITAPGLWTGNEFLGVMMDNGSGAINVLPSLYVVTDAGTLVQFNTVNTLNKTKIKLFLGSIPATTTWAPNGVAGYTETDAWLFQTHEAIAPGTYVIQSCELYNITGDCP